MTTDERNRIDALIKQVADWRVEMKDELLAAVREHQERCLREHLNPIGDKLDRLITETERDSAERAAMRRLRKRINLMAAAAVTAIGAATPFILHYL